jgi:hypothetical protein
LAAVKIGGRLFIEPAELARMVRPVGGGRHGQE